jgi:hypothetical protein
MEKTIFRAYAAQADGMPAGCDHVSVSTDDGADWGCFGRSAADLRNAQDCRAVAVGEGYRSWAEQIQSNDNGGLELHKTGKCHNLANRLLAVTGTDVRTAGTDAAIMFVFGKYGFNIQAFISRLRAGAAAVNNLAPNTISESDIETVISKVNQAKFDELQIIEEYFRNALPSQQLTLTTSEQDNVAAIYSQYFDTRESLQGDPSTYFDRLKPVAIEALIKVRALLGENRFQIIFKAAPHILLDSLGQGF